MKILKKIGIVVVVLVVIYVVLGLIGPSDYKVTRSIKIEAPVDVVFDQTSKFGNWAAWSPWAEEDPDAKYSIEKDDKAVGARMGWEGEISGKGSMTITEIVENEKMIYELSFVEPWVMSSVGGFIYTQEDGIVNLEWYDEGNIPFTQRPMMLFMNLEEMMGPMFEKGLAGIKKISEEMKSEKSIEVTEEIVESKTILFIEESSSLVSGEIGEKIGGAYGEIMALMSVAKLETTSAPMNITRKFSLEEMQVDFSPAIVVNELPEGLELSGRIEKGETYAGKVVKTVHVGPYTNLKSTYDALIAYMVENGYEENGLSWEEYIDDPTLVAEEELRTNIYFPVK